MTKPKNIFNERGTAAETLIAELCGDTYFRDFCFKNPYVDTGKGSRELCDVLIVLGEVAIIWQIKYITPGKFKQGYIDKAISQCRGAKGRLAQLDKIELPNVAGNVKTIDASGIKEVYLIAAIEGEVPELLSFYESSSKGDVHIFLEKFTRYATKHLNTVNDFVRYLRTKERFLSNDKGLILGGGEEELLAVYINNNRTFGNMEGSEATRIFLDIEGSAEELENDAGYQTKQELDAHWGRVWDLLIQKKSAGLPRGGGIGEPQDRDKFLVKMMKHDRFERRILGKTYVDAAFEAAEGPSDETFVYRRYYPAAGVTYAFAFMGSLDSDKSPRQDMLYVTALAARKKFPENTMVIAVGSERNMIENQDGCSFDWVLLDMNDEDLEEAMTPEITELMERSNTLQRPRVQAFTAYEYPEDFPEDSNE